MNAKQITKDATALGLLAASGGLFVLRACRSDSAVKRAADKAIGGATVAGPLAGAFVFAASKASKSEYHRQTALEDTAAVGAIAAVVVGAAFGLGSLAKDAVFG